MKKKGDIFRRIVESQNLLHRIQQFFFRNKYHKCVFRLLCDIISLMYAKIGLINIRSDLYHNYN